MTVNANDNERLLVSGVRRGDTAAMKAVYKLHIRYLTAVCSRYIINPEDVKDILQESFMKVFSAIDTFEYRGEGSLKGWLTKIVINETLRIHTSQQPIRFSGNNRSRGINSLRGSAPRRHGCRSDIPVHQGTSRRVPHDIQSIRNRREEP